MNLCAAGSLSLNDPYISATLGSLLKMSAVRTRLVSDSHPIPSTAESLTLLASRMNILPLKLESPTGKNPVASVGNITAPAVAGVVAGTVADMVRDADAGAVRGAVAGAVTGVVAEVVRGVAATSGGTVTSAEVKLLKVLRACVNWSSTVTFRLLLDSDDMDVLSFDLRLNMLMDEGVETAKPGANKGPLL